MYRTHTILSIKKKSLILTIIKITILKKSKFFLASIVKPQLDEIYCER